MIWTLHLTRKAVKHLRNLEQRDRDRIIPILREMLSQPFGGDHRVISGFSGVHRRRVGPFRITYHADLERRVVTVVGIKRRGAHPYRW